MTMSVRIVAMCILMLSASFGQAASRLPVTQLHALSFGTSVAVAQATSWHSMTQAQRNEKIIARANVDDNHYVYPKECKGWVQDVVYSASGNTVWLPNTTSLLYTWCSDPSVYSVPKPFRVEWAQRGWIIQMRWQNVGDKKIYPHTIIIENVYSTYMDIIDCNLFAPYTVKHRTMTFDYFYQHLTGQYDYTLYYVL